MNVRVALPVLAAALVTAAPASAASLSVRLPASVGYGEQAQVSASGDAPEAATVSAVDQAGSGPCPAGPDDGASFELADDVVEGPFAVATAHAAYGAGPHVLCAYLTSATTRDVLAAAQQAFDVVLPPPSFTVARPTLGSPFVEFSGVAPLGAESYGAVVGTMRCPASLARVQDELISGRLLEIAGAAADPGPFGGLGVVRHLLPGRHRLCAYVFGSGDAPLLTVSEPYAEDFGPWLGTGRTRTPRAGRWTGVARQSLLRPGGFKRFVSRGHQPSFRVRHGRLTGLRVPVHSTCDTREENAYAVVTLGSHDRMRVRGGRVSLTQVGGFSVSVQGRFVTRTTFRGRFGVRRTDGFRFGGMPYYCSGVTHFTARRRGP